MKAIMDVADVLMNICMIPYISDTNLCNRSKIQLFSPEPMIGRNTMGTSKIWGMIQEVIICYMELQAGFVFFVFPLPYYLKRTKVLDTEHFLTESKF